MQRSLVLIKPDAVQRGLAGKIINRFERRGLKIVAMKMLLMDEALASRHYDIHKEKPFFHDLVRFITSCPIIAVVFEAENAIDVIRQTMGTTNAAQASPGSIRGEFAIDLQQNLVHGSDSVESAEREIYLFFKENEIYNYHRDLDRWITES